MAKGYWIGRVDVNDAEGYKPYAAANAAIFKKFGGRFVVARRQVRDASKARARSRNVVIEFPDYAAALACYRSPEYQAQHQAAAAAFDRRSSSSSRATTARSRSAFARPRGSAIPPAYPRRADRWPTCGLIVAGAGGRMGRTLVKAIADSKGFALAGALEDARSPLIGWDAGTLAGLGENGVKLTGDAGAADGEGRRHHRFHRAGGDRRLCRARRQGRQGAHHRHHRPDAPPTKPRSRTPPRRP